MGRQRLTCLLAVAGGGLTLAYGQNTNLVVGVLLPPEEPYAVSVSNGVLLAAAEANASGTCNVRVVVRGRVGQWGADAVEAARMVLDDGAGGLIAPHDGAATHLALQVAGRTAIPVVTLCGDSSVTQTGVPWMLRLAPTTSEEAEALLNGMVRLGGVSNLVALVPGGRGGREISSDLAQAANRTHLFFNRIIEYSPLQAPAGGLEDQALEPKPGAILLWLAPGEASVLAQRLRNAGYKGLLAGPGRLNTPAFTATAGTALEGFLIPVIARTEKEERRWGQFQAAFERRYAATPDIIAGLSYDAASILIRILEQTDPASIPRSFPVRFSLPGASGLLTFDAQGNRKLVLGLQRAHKGRFASIEAVP